MWEDAAKIITACVLANQMGLLHAMEDTLHIQFKILSCPKCSTFWMSLIWHLLSHRNALNSLAVSFLSSYAALWLMLALDALSVIYNSLYEKIRNKAESSTDTDALP